MVIPQTGLDGVSAVIDCRLRWCPSASCHFYARHLTSDMSFLLSWRAKILNI